MRRIPIRAKAVAPFLGGWRFGRHGRNCDSPATVTAARQQQTGMKRHKAPNFIIIQRDLRAVLLAQRGFARYIRQAGLGACAHARGRLKVSGSRVLGMTKHYARPLAKLTIVLALATAASGCQTVSDLDPTGLLSDDEQIAETQFPTDSEQQAEADANTTTPDLAGIPTRPAAPNTVAQADAAQSVTAAGAQAQYSAEALRARHRSGRAAAGSGRCQCGPPGACRHGCAAHHLCRRCPAHGRFRAGQ